MGAGGGEWLRRGGAWSPFKDERSRRRQILQYDQVEGRREGVREGGGCLFWDGPSFVNTVRGSDEQQRGGGWGTLIESDTLCLFYLHSNTPAAAPLVRWRVEGGFDMINQLKRSN